MKTVLRWIWLGLKGFVVVSAALVFGLLFLILAAASTQQPKIAAVEEGALLDLTLRGTLVETKSQVDPTELVSNPLLRNLPAETLMRDVVFALRQAKDDDRIAGLVLNLEGFLGGGPAAVHRLAAEIAAFKQSGKPVIAYSRYYSQGQYLLAAQADHVWINPAGSVLLSGYASVPFFYADALEKIKATPHIFRVGEYKSAVEPYSRSSMSEAAKEAGRELIGGLWDAYVEAVAAARNIDPDLLRAYTQNPAPAIRAAGGDPAEVLVALGLVARLVPHSLWQLTVAEQTDQEPVRGKDGEFGYRSVALDAYLQNVRSKQKAGDEPMIAVITARGAILPGQAGPQATGSDSLAKLIARARRSDRVKAVVLRVDSPGGSMFAADLIRQELARLRAAGKPLVASYASQAASAAVYISAEADQVFTEPLSVTGSIGIYSIYVTFEETLSALGIQSDGVTTSPLAGGMDPLRPLRPELEALLQTTLEDGYRDFLSVVAQGRALTVDRVDELARGRVYLGARYEALGLADEIGGLDEALAAAADLAGLAQWRAVPVEPRPTPYQRFLVCFLNAAEARGIWSPPKLQGPVGQLVDRVGRDLQRLEALRDPDHLYAICQLCEVRTR